MSRSGIGGLARAVNQAAAQAGVTLIWEHDHVVVRGSDFDVLFPESRTARLLPEYLWRLDELRRRLVFTSVDGRQIADCRREVRVRLDGSGDEIALPEMPELIDFASGYVARGGPGAGAVVFDFGAFVGEMTIAFARQVGPAGRVFAFEPSPLAGEFLARNVRTAGLTNVTLVPRGVWSESTTLVLAESSGRDSAFGSAHASQPGAVSIAVVSLADACTLAGVVPDFVKMDIEGAEVEVIQSALEFIRGRRIRFAIASYHVRDGAPTSVALERLFRAAGYECATGYSEHPTTWAWPRNGASPGLAGRSL